MNTIEHVIDLGTITNEESLFEKFNEAFNEEIGRYSWKISSWSSLDDFLWGYIQGPITDSSPSSVGSEIEKIVIKIINSAHLAKVPALLIKNKDITILEALRESFENIRAGQVKVSSSENPQILLNSSIFIES